MKHLVEIALGCASRNGASYADVRVVSSKSESISVKNAALDVLDYSESLGVGIRAIVDGAWGFASTPDLSEESIEKTAQAACRIAKASSAVKREDVVLSEVFPEVARYKTPISKDPFEVKMEDKIDLLLEADSIMRKNPKVRLSGASLSFFRTDKLFASTEGAYIEQQITESGGGITATATAPGETQTRGYPNGRAGGHRTSGYEYIEELKFAEHAERVAEEAVALLQAPQCPSMHTDVIMDGSCLALQIHESVGHPLELDRVLGSEISLAGASFATTDKLGNLKYGSDIVNLTADATIPGGLGTFGYDDEGVSAQKTPLVRDGVLCGYMSSRETAPKIGRTSSGAALATGYNKIPLVRMTNVNLDPGDWTRDEIIRDTKEGILLEGMGSGSIDDMRTNFQFGPECAYEVKDGSIGRMLKNPTYTAKTVDFWNSCDAVSNDDWQVWGLLTCGKGVPGQMAHVGHGASTARFRRIKVGVGKW